MENIFNYIYAYSSANRLNVLIIILHPKEHPYGLRSPKNASRGLQSVLQAYIMKHFLFSIRPREKKSVPIDVSVNKILFRWITDF